MTHNESLYVGGVVKGPHSWKGKEAYYVTTPAPSETYLRKDWTVGNGTQATGASDETRGFWDSRHEAHLALETWKIQYHNKLHGIKEPELKQVEDIKLYTKKEFLKLIQEFI